MRITYLMLTSIVLWACSGCSNLRKSFNIFPVSQDVALGFQVSQNIDSQYNDKLLDSARHVELYRYIYSVRDSILQNNTLKHKKDFPWRVRIINDPTLNAFCTPGGYIYFYTGILRFLKSEDELAGVMGHEMAHAEMRHSTDALTRQYSSSLLVSLLVSPQYQELANVAASLTHLKYGRSDESESDEYSVRWLYNTSYNPTGASGFFERINTENTGIQTPEFLSTHPNPGKRVEKMNHLWKELGGKEGQTYQVRYQRMLRLLPK